jgi:GNAT superfamily N-acetyltransferase
MLDQVIIRESRPEEDVVVGELVLEAFVTQYAQKLPEVVYTEERKRELRDVAARRAAATVLLAELEGQVVGSVTLYPPGAPGSEAWLPQGANLRQLATTTKLHGKGLSAPLMDAAEALARSWRVSAICLHVRRGAHGVMRMYQRRGYVRDPAGDLDLPTVYLEAYALRLA